MTLVSPDLGDRWAAARESADVVHLDAAAAGRMSRAVISAQVGHLHAETTRGAYVAAESVAPLLATARGAVAGLLGGGLGADDVVLVGSCTAALVAVLDAWPLPAGSRIGIVATEFGSNAMAVAARAERDGLALVDLPLDDSARIDLERFDPSGLALVVLPQVASQRGNVQPAAAVGAACAAAGVPLVLDVAQAFGQVDVSGIGAAAYVGTSRKWVCGPRGVGFAAVTAAAAELLRPRYPHLDTHGWTVDGRQAGPVVAGAPRLGIGESSVVARVGFATALAELVPDAAAVVARIAALGAYARSALAGVAGWQVVEPVDEPSGIVTLRPPAGVSVEAVRDMLLGEHEILTTAIPTSRAPRDMTAGPVLRASLHAYLSTADVDALVTALPLVT